MPGLITAASRALSGAQDRAEQIRHEREAEEQRRAADELAQQEREIRMASLLAGLRDQGFRFGDEREQAAPQEISVATDRDKVVGGIDGPVGPNGMPGVHLAGQRPAVPPSIPLPTTVDAERYERTGTVGGRALYRDKTQTPDAKAKLKERMQAALDQKKATEEEAKMRRAIGALRRRPDLKDRTDDELRAIVEQGQGDAYLAPEKPVAPPSRTPRSFMVNGRAVEGFSDPTGKFYLPDGTPVQGNVTPYRAPRAPSGGERPMTAPQKESYFQSVAERAIAAADADLPKDAPDRAHHRLQRAVEILVADPKTREFFGKDGGDLSYLRAAASAFDERPAVRGKNAKLSLDELEADVLGKTGGSAASPPSVQPLRQTQPLAHSGSDLAAARAAEIQRRIAAGQGTLEQALASPSVPPEVKALLRKPRT